MCKCNSLMCAVVYIIVCYVLLLCVYSYKCVNSMLMGNFKVIPVHYRTVVEIYC